ncbi:MAG TPA: alpha/beta hydrolase [Candidatus Baltobacteraceae bacterium]|nr:alpha/beta hydrolase [Candidatus Baltobacteraceae bacterium]
MPTLHVDGLDVAYSVEGAGPPVVMLHGASSSAREDWSAQLPSFRKAFRVYLPDARGHGGTRWDAAQGFSNELLVADLEGFVDGLGLTTFHLVGFSLGAMTALTYATRHPARLRTLLIAGIDTEREPRASVARRLMDPDRIERDEPAWAAQLERRHGPVQGSGAWRSLMRAIAHDVATQPLLSPAALREIRVPTLLAYGDRDVFAPLPHVVALYRQLPEARLLVAPDCDHQVMVSRPALFNDAAAAFYRETEAVARARASGVSGATQSTNRGGKRAPIPTALPPLAEPSSKEAHP